LTFDEFYVQLKIQQTNHCLTSSSLAPLELGNHLLPMSSLEKIPAARIAHFQLAEKLSLAPKILTTQQVSGLGVEQNLLLLTPQDLGFLTRYNFLIDDLAHKISMY
jgi:hypothetical protein